MMLLDKHSPLPLYAQLAESLRGRILDRLYLPGEQIPTERDLMAEYQVSRNTVRQAIETLTKDGLVMRQHGYGTYVSGLSQKFHYKLDAFYENIDLLRRAGYQKIDVQIVSVETIPCPQHIQKALHLPDSGKINCFTKRFTTEEGTAMFTRDYLPLPDSGHDGQINRQQAFLEFLEERTQQRVEYVLLDILPVAAAGEIAAAFDCPPGTPLLLCEELFLDRSQTRPIAFGQNYLHPSMSSFRLLTHRA
jgi:DNA-binding GntR family transcriptional regulator